MADEASERAVYVIPIPGAPKNPDGTVMEIQMYAPTQAEAVVMGRAAFDLLGRGSKEEKVRSWLSMARLIDRLIVNLEDKLLLEELMLSEEVPQDKMMELAPDLLRIHAETVGEAEAPTTGPVKRVRRSTR